MKGWRKPKAFAAAYNAQKRFLAFVLTLAMIFTSVGTDLNVSYAAQGNKVDFMQPTVGGGDSLKHGNLQALYQQLKMRRLHIHIFMEEIPVVAQISYQLSPVQQGFRSISMSVQRKMDM